MNKNNFKKTTWIPESLNSGWIYTNKITNSNRSKNLLEYLTKNYQHSSTEKWSERIRQGEIQLNKKRTLDNLKLKKGDLISWSRPPWKEARIPTNWEIIFDNQDILVINKPAGLPTTPGGGFLKHTLTELLSEAYKGYGKNEIPKPVHRLGRFTSGVLICARKKETRANLSKLFHNNISSSSSFRRVYLALAKHNPSLQVGQSIEIQTPISKCFHPYLGEIWNIQNNENQGINLKAYTQIKLIEKRKNCDLLKITIYTGRPHQIRIHLASIGTPLIGDKVYKSNGQFSSCSTPGDGGYFLHAHQLLNIPINDKLCSFEALIPEILKSSII